MVTRGRLEGWPTILFFLRNQQRMRPHTGTPRRVFYGVRRRFATQIGDFMTSDGGFSMENSGFTTSDGGFSMENSGFITSDGGFSVENSGCMAQNSGFTTEISKFR